MKKLLLAAFLLSGCGFTPVYDTTGSTYTALENYSIEIAPIPDQYGMNMRHQLKEIIPQVSEKPKKSYILNVSAPQFSGYDKTITNDEFASTIQATATTDFTLTDTKTHKVLFKNSVSATSSYMVESSPYATTVAKNKVYEELTQELTQQIGQNVLAYITKDI